MNIVGISAFYHDSACCLLQNGRLIAAASEERFTRVKHDTRLPVRAYRYCLQAAGLTPADVDAIAYYEDPVKKEARQLAQVAALTPDERLRIQADRPEQMMRHYLGHDGPILTFDHHLSHAASAYYFSGFDSAAILTVDGVGEMATTTYSMGHGSQIDTFETVDFPHSLGLFYATITAYLGFRVNQDEYKVMGAAAYGRPSFTAEMRQLIAAQTAGQFALNMAYFDFLTQKRMFSQQLVELLGQLPRQAGEAMTDFHYDIAHSAQVVLEEILLEKVGYLHAQSNSPNLCMAGGVALNAVANGRIRREGPFERLFIQPAAGDAGGCLGAAGLAHVALTGERPEHKRMRHVYVGPSFERSEVEAIIQAVSVPAADYRGRRDQLNADVAAQLAAGKIVGWFNGRMEFGPRALGARSILADPRNGQMRGKINAHIKRRDHFQPFAPAVLAEHAAAQFDCMAELPFMIETCRVISELDLPAVTHVDGSARPQTVDAAHSPEFAALLSAFYKLTGCPILLNTSFNMRGEPIVCTPVDALFSFAKAGLDLLVLEDFVIDRNDIPDDLAELLQQWQTAPGHAFLARSSAISEAIYTFV